MNEKISVSVKEAAELSGLSTWKVYELLNTGEVEGRYVGSRRLVLYSSLRAFIEGLPQDAPS